MPAGGGGGEEGEHGGAGDAVCACDDYGLGWGGGGVGGEAVEDAGGVNGERVGVGDGHCGCEMGQIIGGRGSR